MKRYRVIHRTYYNFSGTVQLGPHVLRLRPREGAELHIESSSLRLVPSALIRWHRDAEGNSIATALFDAPATQLSIESEVIVQNFEPQALDFPLSREASSFPFTYAADDRLVLSPYLELPDAIAARDLQTWVDESWQPGEEIQTWMLLERLNRRISQRMSYSRREEAGIQSPMETLKKGQGSCRDFANLFMAATRYLGIASRFVSGYLVAPPSWADFGATHAWAEVYLPGAGWRGFDPTLGEIVGPKHIAVAVARLPESVPPIEGSYVGPPNASLDVGVWVTEL